MTGWMLTVMFRYPKTCTEFKSNKEASSANSALKCIYTQTPVKKKKKKKLGDPSFISHDAKQGIRIQLSIRYPHPLKLSK